MLNISLTSGTPIRVRRHLYIATVPCCWRNTCWSCDHGDVMETVSALLPFVRGICTVIDADDDFKIKNMLMN